MNTSHTSALLSLAIFSCDVTAGGGAYFGIGYATHELATRTEVAQTFSPPPPVPTSIISSASEDLDAAMISVGYRYKRRNSDRLFLSPELVLSRLKDELYYSTDLKAGAGFEVFSVYAIAGLGHVEKFDKNQFNYGVGLEYKLTSTISLNIEWQRLDTISENTIASTNFGTQLVTTTTDTSRDLDIATVSLVFYTHE